MATAKRCSVDQQYPASMQCIGCDKYFCTRHVKLHQDEMSSELNKIIQDHDQLQNMINNEGQNDEQQNSIIKEINQWRDRAIVMIKQVAAQTCQQATNLLNDNRMKLNAEFQSFSKELVELKESENYVEHDLQRFNDMIKKFQQDLEQVKKPITIELRTEDADKIDWDTLIYVEEKGQNEKAPIATTSSSPPPSQLKCASYSCMK